MENCEYKTILGNLGVEENEYKNTPWKTFIRQFMISTGVCCIYFLHGLFLGAPTVLVAQIRKDVNSTEIITEEMLSWLTTLPVISSVPFVVIVLSLFNLIGRKYTFLFVVLVEIIGFIIFYNSTNLYQVLISEVCAGAASASVITITPVIVAEYTSPKYRGIFLALKGATAFWGIWISNAIGTYFHWKNIAIVSFVCSAYLVSVMAWPESPYWLARKGRYAESAKSHRWLKGVNENSEKELAQLINSQINYHSSSGISGMWSVITSPSFYKPTVMSVILFAQYNFTGKFVISMYAIEVLKRLTPDQSFVYKEMLILDGVTVLSMYVGCVLSRYFRRRTLLLLFSGVGIAVLFILSLYLYLLSMTVVMQNDVLILLLLTVFSIAISCGPMILCTSIYGEIVPLKYQHFTMICVSSCDIITMSLLLKLSPFIFDYFKMHGSFLFFGISSSIFFIILYIHFPETKDKTIQDIAKIFDKATTLEEQNKTAPKEVQSNTFISAASTNTESSLKLELYRIPDRIR